MNGIFDYFFSIFAKQTFYDFIKFIVPIIATYFFTKYTVDNPSKKEIKEKQFHNIYLPLYKLLCTKNVSSMTTEQINKYCKKMLCILSKNYELAFPELHILSLQLYKTINDNGDFKPILEKIIYQISMDYESLKKTLGYPHMNAYQLFKRKTVNDKIRTVLGYILVLYVFPGVFILSFIVTPTDFTNSIYYFIGLFVILYISIKANSRNF